MRNPLPSPHEPIMVSLTTPLKFRKGRRALAVQPGRLLYICRKDPSTTYSFTIFFFFGLTKTHKMSLPNIDDIAFLSEMLNWTDYDVDTLDFELDDFMDISASVQPQTLAENTFQISSTGASDYESPAFTRPVSFSPSAASPGLTTHTQHNENVAFLNNDMAYGPQRLSEHFSNEERAWTNSTTLDTFLSGSFNTQ